MSRLHARGVQKRRAWDAKRTRISITCRLGGALLNVKPCRFTNNTVERKKRGKKGTRLHACGRARARSDSARQMRLQAGPRYAFFYPKGVQLSTTHGVAISKHGKRFVLSRLVPSRIHVKTTRLVQCVFRRSTRGPATNWVDAERKNSWCLRGVTVIQAE